jgi:hypothetical protein
VNDPSLDPILAYLREHSWRYSLAALREQLLKTGYDPAAVDRAIAAFQEPPVPPAPRQRFRPWVLQIVTFNSVLTIVLTMILSSPSKEQYWIVGPVILAFLVCLVEFFIVILLKIPRETRHLGDVLLQGIGLFAGLAVVVLGGLCAVGP